MNNNKDIPDRPPAPSPSQEALLPNGKTQDISTSAVLLGLICGSAAYAVALVVLLVAYLALVFVEVEVRPYNYSLSYALFMLKNFVWDAQRFIAFVSPLFAFSLLRKRRLSLAVSFIIGGGAMLLLLLLLYPFVPLEG